MSCCNRDRFVNQQTYLNTICQTRKPRPPQKPPQPPCYCQYDMCTPNTKFTVRTDCCGTHFSIDFNIPPHKKR